MHSLVNIEAERARLGMTREQLSAHLGVTSKTLRAWTAGRSALPSDKLVLMHELYRLFAGAFHPKKELSEMLQHLAQSVEHLFTFSCCAFVQEHLLRQTCWPYSSDRHAEPWTQ